MTCDIWHVTHDMKMMEESSFKVFFTILLTMTAAQLKFSTRFFSWIFSIQRWFWSKNLCAMVISGVDWDQSSQDWRFWALKFHVWALNYINISRDSKTCGRAVVRPHKIFLTLRKILRFACVNWIFFILTLFLQFFLHFSYILSEF